MIKLGALQTITFFVSIAATMLIMVSGFLCLREGYLKVAAIDFVLAIMNLFFAYNAFKKLTA